MKLLLVVAIVLAVSAVAWGKAGEEFERCKGPLGIPALGTVCQKECAIIGNMPFVTCKQGLLCCTLGYRDDELEENESISKDSESKSEDSESKSEDSEN